MNKLAVLNGKKEFPEGIPFIKPYFPDYLNYEKLFKKVFSTGMLSKGKFIKEYETRVSNYLRNDNIVAVSSGTTGLILSLKALEIGRGDEVIVPSFTFCATVHAIVESGATPVFVDCLESSFTIDSEKVKKAITDKTKAILAVHIFGIPCDVYSLEKIAKQNQLKLIYDAAHAFGTQIDERPISDFGDISVFSTSPTKTLVTGEGGLVVTNSLKIADKIRLLREYGNPGDYNCTEVGINGRLCETAAITGIMSLDVLSENLDKRNEIGNLYRQFLSNIKGIQLQEIPSNVFSTFKDMGIVVDPNVFGLDRDTIVRVLNAEGIPTRNYFYPAVHKMDCYAQYSDIVLATTEKISENILCLPMHPYLEEETIKSICSILINIQEHSKEITEYGG